MALPTAVPATSSLQPSPLDALFPDVTLATIQQAQVGLKGVLNHTPVLQHAGLNKQVGAQVYLKAECLQHYGSFKLRGAYHVLANLPSALQQAGVVAYSSGNHAQAIAYAAKQLGIPATIVMPSDAPAIKRDRTMQLGATVRLYNRATESREALGQEVAAATGAVLVPPYDHAGIITGQGTLALETVQWLAAENEPPLDDWLVCCGGGGLAAGCAVVLQALSPQTQVWTVEPEGYDDMAQSLQARQRLRITPSQPSGCDALLHTEPGEQTFPILSALGAKGLTVSEGAVREAMRFAAQELRLVLEPGGAVALAALRTQPERFKGRRVGVVLSGGNVEWLLWQSVLKEENLHAG